MNTQPLAVRFTRDGKARVRAELSQADDGAPPSDVVSAGHQPVHQIVVRAVLAL